MLFVKPFRSPLAFVSCRNLPQHNDPNDNRFLSLQLEDGVYARKFGRGEPWTEGKSVEVLGPRYCKAQLKGFGNITWKRHVDQLMRRYLGLEENLPENTKRPTPSQITAYDNRSSSRAIFLQENDGTWLSGRGTRGNDTGSETYTGEKTNSEAPTTPDVITSENPAPPSRLKYAAQVE